MSLPDDERRRRAQLVADVVNTVRGDVQRTLDNAEEQLVGAIYTTAERAAQRVRAAIARARQNRGRPR